MEMGFRMMVALNSNTQILIPETPLPPHQHPHSPASLSYHSPSYILLLLLLSVQSFEPLYVHARVSETFRVTPLHLQSLNVWMRKCLPARAAPGCRSVLPSARQRSNRRWSYVGVSKNRGTLLVVRFEGILLYLVSWGVKKGHPYFGKYACDLGHVIRSPGSWQKSSGSVLAMGRRDSTPFPKKG